MPHFASRGAPFLQASMVWKVIWRMKQKLDSGVNPVLPEVAKPEGLQLDQ